jgi:hypothetical protein
MRPRSPLHSRVRRTRPPTVRRFVQALGAFAVLLGAGCGLGTLDAVLEYEDQRFDPLLVGRWSDTDGIEGALIRGNKETGYRIQYVDEDALSGEFTGHLGVIGGKRVLDLEPVEPSIERSDLYKSLLYRLHAVLVIDTITATELRFRAIEPDSVNALLQREPSATPHFENGDFMILTGRTPELQRFLGEFLRRPGVLGEPVTWRRRERTG